MEKIDIISDIHCFNLNGFLLHKQEKSDPYIYSYFYFDDTFDLPKVYCAQLISGGTLIGVYNIFLECVQSREITHFKFKQS